nr:hypothetical protein Iba_scaffold901321CG0010 [Ipomoea batatas]
MLKGTPLELIIYIISDAQGDSSSPLELMIYIISDAQGDSLGHSLCASKELMIYIIPDGTHDLHHPICSRGLLMTPCAHQRNS